MDTSRNLVDTSRNVMDSSRNLVDISRNLVDTSRELFMALCRQPLLLAHADNPLVLIAETLYFWFLPNPFIFDGSDEDKNKEFQISFLD